VKPLGLTHWDVSVLARPLVVHADPTGISGPTAAAAAAGLAALTRGSHDEAAVEAGGLGIAGVVAVRGSEGVFEVHEVVDGWVFVRSAVPTPNPDDLAAAAAVRAVRLAEARRARGAT
jgi:hypothetical protein